MKNKKADFTMAKVIGFILLLVFIVWCIFWFVSLRGKGESILGGIFG